MNAALQSMFHTPGFVDLIRQINDPSAQAFVRLADNYGNARSQSPADLRKEAATFARDLFTDFQQHDASEAWDRLIARWKQQNPLLTRMFEMPDSPSQITDRGLFHTILNDGDLFKLWDMQFTHTCGNIGCEDVNCNDNNQLSPVVAIRFNIFDNHSTRGAVSKITTNRHVPKTLGSSHHLTSFVVHDGRSSRSGHYRAYAKHNNQWYHFNDSRVNPVSEQIALAEAKQAYFAFIQILLWFLV